MHISTDIYYKRLALLIIYLRCTVEWERQFFYSTLAIPVVYL